MGALFSIFRGKEREEVYLAGCVPCTNAFWNNHRGIIATIAGIIFLAIGVNNSMRWGTVLAVTNTMSACMLFSPVPVGACALIPLFCFPVFGVLDSATCCGALINENIIFFFVGGWLLMLLNNCGMDKRLVCRFLTCGSEEAFTLQKLLCKSCMAAFFTSALSNRELSSQVIMNYISSALEPLQSLKTESNYVEAKAIICNAVAISSTIGSLCIMHSAVTTMQMRAIFCDASDVSAEFPDVFNFLNYSAFAVPMAISMFIVNLFFQSILLFQYAEDRDMSKYSQDQVRKTLLKNQKDLGPASCHEKLSTLFLLALLICYFTRWSQWLNMGWGAFRAYAGSPDLCGLKDATTASIFVVALHFLPKSLNFIKIFSAKKQRDKPVMKVESGILFWKFIDNNTDYSLFLALGAGIMIYKAMILWNLHEELAKKFGDDWTKLPWNGGIFLVVLMAVFWSNLMPGLGVQACVMPIMMGMATVGKGKWPQRMYLVALAVGMGSALGFCYPSRNSPLRYVRTIGKASCMKQFAYSILSVIVCTILLWVFLCFYAPILWDPNDVGIVTQSRPLPPSAGPPPTPAPAEGEENAELLLRL